jgi:hypothetical protein
MVFEGAIRSETGARSMRDVVAYKRALARGDDPEEIIQQIAQHRSTDKANPEYYARHTVEKAQADLEYRQTQKNTTAPQTTQGTDLSHDRNE